MKFIITGANGYIATAVAKYLSKEHELVAMIRKGSKNKNTDLYKETIYTDGSFSNINKSISSVGDVDGVIHLAAYFSTKTDNENSMKLLEDNVLFTSKILSACANNNILFLGTSTFSMFDERHEFNPRSLYDYTKKAMLDLAETYSVNAGILYISDTYGYNDLRPKVPNLLFNGKIKKLNSKGSQKINLTHVEDIARALEFIAKDLHNKKEPNISEFEIYYPENEIDLKTLVELLDVDVEFGDNDNYGIPPLIHPIPNYSPIHSVKDIKNVLSGELK